MSRPNEGGEVRIKRVLRYLRGKPTCLWRFPWQEAAERLVGHSDSDWAGCAITRRSTSGGGISMGQHLLTHWSRTQTCVALSSGEAELNAILKTASEGLNLKHMMEEVGLELGLHIRGDSSASHGTLNRLGTGRIKHLETRQLWLQEKVRDGTVTIEKIRRDINWADTLTHAWSTSDEYQFHSMGIVSV